jgi:hypothetical protein
MLEEERPCEVCGRFSEECTCPECSVCHQIGNTECYIKHNLGTNNKWTYTETQTITNYI